MQGGGHSTVLFDGEDSQTLDALEMPSVVRTQRQIMAETR